MVPDPVADMIQRRLLEEKAAKRVATEILTEEDQLASAVRNVVQARQYNITARLLVSSS